MELGTGFCRDCMLGTGGGWLEPPADKSNNTNLCPLDIYTRAPKGAPCFRVSLQISLVSPRIARFCARLNLRSLSALCFRMFSHSSLFFRAIFSRLLTRHSLRSCFTHRLLKSSSAHFRCSFAQSSHTFSLSVFAHPSAQPFVCRWRKRLRSDWLRAE